MCIDNIISLLFSLSMLWCIHLWRSRLDWIYHPIPDANVSKPICGDLLKILDDSTAVMDSSGCFLPSGGRKGVKGRMRGGEKERKEQTDLLWLLYDGPFDYLLPQWFGWRLLLFVRFGHVCLMSMAHPLILAGGRGGESGSWSGGGLQVTKGRPRG